MKIKFTKDLRGRVLNQDMSPINITLENLLRRLDSISWNYNSLSIYAKKVCDAYKLSKIFEQLKNVDMQQRVTRIRENILSLYGGEIGDNCLAIYLFAYCVNRYSDKTFLEALKKFYEEAEITKNTNQINTIINIGRADGIFLKILDDKGRIIDLSFMNKWMYACIDQVFSKLIEDTEDEELIRDRFLIYNRIRNKQVDFENNLEKGIIKQQKKNRLIYKVNGTNEEIALKYLKRRLDIELKIKYANRGYIMKELFPIIENINCLGDFTIFRFDFKHFFESVEARRIFDEYIVNTNLRRYEKDLLKQLTELYKYCFAGLPTSNAFIEIVANRFDQVLKSKLWDRGLCFSSRYVDDGILVFNEFVDEVYIQRMLNDAIQEVFNMPSVKLNDNKTCYLTKYTGDLKFNYLGYQFEKSGRGNKVIFKFGIADSKISKYQNKLDSIIKQYIKDNNVELFRHRILYFISRAVFYTNTNSRYSILGKWDVGGIIENYGLLRRYIENKGRLIRTTQVFLFNGVYNGCARAGLINKKMPYFLRGKGKDVYSIAYGLQKNKTIIFHPNIGWSSEYLKKQITRLDSEKDLNKKSYRELSKVYCTILRL